jgi:hypothetical protein
MQRALDCLEIETGAKADTDARHKRETAVENFMVDNQTIQV